MEVDEIMEQFAGREDELMDQVEKKYNPDYVSTFGGVQKVNQGFVDEQVDSDDEYM